MNRIIELSIFAPLLNEQINGFFAEPYAQVLIINRSDKEYIQVLKSPQNEFIIEYREIFGESFKHYRIGLIPLTKVNRYVETFSGQVHGKTSEFVSDIEAKNILKAYLSGYPLRDTFNTRNVTKRFK